MKDFDFYEFAAVIAPGAAVIVGLVALFFPSYEDKLTQLTDVSIGGLGLGLLVAYVVGQLLQVLGNIIENIWWWLWGGTPTDWIRSEKHGLLAKVQRDRLQDQIRLLLKDGRFDLTAQLGKADWRAVTRQIYAAVASAGQNARIDKFNGIYGLCRGIVAAMSVLMIVAVSVDYSAWKLESGLALAMLLALCRMHRFSRLYAQELFIQFLQLSEMRSAVK